MAKGRQAKGRRSETSPKKPIKVKLADSGAPKQVLSKPVSCVDCGCTITDDTRALNCEKCTTAWKCSACIGIRNATYEDLISESGNELRWFCEPCFTVVMQPQSDNDIMQTLQKLTLQLSEIQEKLEAKVDCAKVDTLEKIVQGLDARVNDGYKGVIQSVEKSTSHVATVVEMSKLDVSAVQGCVEEVMQVQRVQSLEEKREAEEREKRKKNVIVYGLPEPTAAISDDRRKEDLDRAEELLHKIACDDVSVKHIARLGPPPTRPDDKPRPVKLDLMSMESRNKVLKNAKNLRVAPETLWKTVFIQQDFTPKEREVRKVLVQQLKTRRTAGETNLILVNGNIVQKRTYEY